jgi:hypothetical protein
MAGGGGMRWRRDRAWAEPKECDDRWGHLSAGHGEG